MKSLSLPAYPINTSDLVLTYTPPVLLSFPVTTPNPVHSLDQPKRPTLCVQLGWEDDKGVTAMGMGLRVSDHETWGLVKPASWPSVLIRCEIPLMRRQSLPGIHLNADA